MSEKNNRSNNTVVPNDGSYLGAKAGKALKDKKIREDFEQAWIDKKISPPQEDSSFIA